MVKKQILKILLINPPSKIPCHRDYYCSHTTKGDYLWQPFDLQILSAKLKSERLFFIDAIAGNFSQKYCLERIRQIQPDFIFSQIGNATLHADISFLNKISRITDSNILITGDIARTESDILLEKNPFLEGIIYNIFHNDIKAYIRDGISSPVNIITRNSKIIEKCPDNFKTGVPVLKFFKHNRYYLPHAKKSPMYTIATTFGCPYSCKYCHFEKIPASLRDTSDFYNELIEVKKHGFKQLHFRDQTFGYNKEHRKEILSILKNFDFSCIVYSRVDILSEEDIKEFKEAGIDCIEVGIESEEDSIREDYNKKITNKEYIKFFHWLEKYNMDSLASFILGFEGQNENTEKNMLEFIKKLNPDVISINLLAKKAGTSLYKDNLRLSDMGPTCGDIDSKKYQKIQRAIFFKYYLSIQFILNQLKKIRSKKDVIRHIKNALGFFKTFHKPGIRG
ncbi:MAG: hypothetical protein C0601_09230 [Candidatus Muiribacterium halophilum]|uniref:Radical SAM core domain-containing protein n=1 Tax=Muiribacterium halophilum TaxID=2053465 RepID=A0A2N5ZDR7_MUIH1|nr:MAG: hypothetical protein C0601_09230 [Candidatus Muirbacterium halophilum]